MTGRVPRVLCLDIDGGYGGSSRSLYESLRCMDRTAVEPEVWYRLAAGPIQERYHALGIPCRVTPDMPRVSQLLKLSPNLYDHGRFFLKFWQAKAFRHDLARQVNERFDLVHFNHESLFFLASWLRRRTSVPFTMHIRTIDWDYDNMFTTWHARSISRVVNHLVFITENEQKSFARVSRWPDGTVIYNIAEPSPPSVTPHDAVPRDGRLKIASLSLFNWVRGTDRLVEIAAALAARGRRDFLFVVAGHTGLPDSLPGVADSLERCGGTLADDVEQRGVAGMFLFLGHVSDPERVLAACDVLIKPTRLDNPWGRDVIEGLAAGRPVLTVGQWEGFVQNGKTGILQKTFDAGAMAHELISLSDNRARLAAMGEAARKHITGLCNGPARAADLLAVWTKRLRS